MSIDMLHPAPDQLEAYVEGSLGAADRAVLESHLTTCARCASEVEEWRAIFAALSSLPRLEPTPGFADRVMAGVQIRLSWMDRVVALLRKLVPTTTMGWVVVTLLLALPVIATGGATAWLLSRPWITSQGLWLFLRERAVDGVYSLAGRAGLALLESDTAVRVVEWTRTILENTGTREIGAIAAICATLIVVSAWVLYQNLFRTSTRGKPHATYCI